MNALVTISLLGWTPVVLLLFMALKPRQAVIVAFITAWLFLPVPVPELLYIRGLPELDKMTVTCLAVLLGAFIFDQGWLLSFRPKWFDIPMAIWCIVPLFSSLTNTDPTVFGHSGIPDPLYDGLSEVLDQTVTWGLPYLIGRVYFTDLDALRELAIGVFVGGLVYIPLCAFELRFSPQLHHILYGVHGFPDFRQSIRGGGYRPTVFMAHGLMVALWMATATLVGVWMWYCGTLRKFMGMPMYMLIVPLLIITVLCKSAGALLLLCIGLGMLYFVKRTHSVWPVIVLIALAPMYMVIRAPQLWDGMNAVELADTVLGEKRAQSLETRLSNENILCERALEKPVFGWGGWGRSRVYDHWGKDVSITDGMWVIALGKHGLVGLASFTAALLLPIVLILKRIPVRTWAHPKAAPAAALAIVLLMYMFDNLMNAMINPVFMLVAGALASQQAIRIGYRSAASPGTREAQQAGPAAARNHNPSIEAA